MNSTIEYIRKLNQASVGVQADWLDRLRNVDAGSDSQVATPEIVLTTKTDLPKYTQGNYTPPVTAVKHQDTSTSKATHQQTNAMNHSGTSTAANISQHGIQVVDANCVQVHGTDYYNQTDTVSGSSAISQGVDAKASGSINSEVKELSSPSPSGTVAKGKPVPAVQGTGGQLESPAVLEDIVRPTIMPLRQSRGTDVIESILPTTKTPDSIGGPMSQPVPLHQPKAIPAVPQQVVEMLSDFGVADDAMSTNDTVSSEEIQHLTSAPSQDRIQQENADREHDLPQHSRICVFPTDNRGEQFTYSLAKRQKLVDLIVDQIIKRFPEKTNPTIMLVGAHREIDVDSAASRIATCLSGRGVGEILLVDGNLQSRQLTSLLGLTGTRGISDAFQGTDDATSLLCDTDNSMLKIIGAGTKESDCLEDLKGASINNLLLKKRFGYTIIAGGISGDPLTDAWSGLADGVYMIVDMDESDRSATVETVDYLRRIGARIVGCIATRA